MPKTQRRAAKPPTLSRRFSKMTRAQRIFSILAVVVVFSLVVTTAGTAIWEDLRGSSSNGSGGSASGNSADDPILNQMRADAQASPSDPATLASLANYLANTGQTGEAILWYQKAIDLSPSNTDLRLDFAIALSKGEKYADAEVQFKKVIAAVPAYAQAYLSMGQLYLDWIPPRDADAIAAFNKAISLDPTSVVAARAREEIARIVPATPGASPVGTP